MKLYVQTDANDIITDAIDYPHTGYTEIDVVSVPSGINGGWFKLEGGLVVEYPLLKPIDESQELKNRIADLELQVAALTGGV